MGTLLDKLRADLVDAQKKQDTVVVSTLRFLLSGLHNAKIAKGEDLTEDEVILEIGREAKRHKESIAAYEAGGRQDLVKKEQAELLVFAKYLPQQLSADEIGKIVDEVISEVGASGGQDLGRVMSAVMTKVKGKVEGGEVSRIVKDKLTGVLSK